MEENVSYIWQIVQLLVESFIDIIASVWQTKKQHPRSKPIFFIANKRIKVNKYIVVRLFIHF